MNIRNRMISTLSVAALAGAVGMGQALADSPVGELEARGHVQIGQQGADEITGIADTTYGWFSGDMIDTRSGQALLTLENGASFGFGKGTQASVEVVDGAVHTSVDSGVLLYALEDGSLELVVESGDYRFSSIGTETRPIEVSSDAEGAAGMIEVLEDGQVQVSVREGVLSASDASGALKYQVASGESVAFDGTEPRQVKTQVGATGGSDDEGRGLIGWAQDNPALAGLAIAAVGYGAYKAFFEDDDSDPDPVSP